MPQCRNRYNFCLRKFLCFLTVNVELTFCVICINIPLSLDPYVYMYFGSVLNKFLSLKKTVFEILSGFTTQFVIVCNSYLYKDLSQLLILLFINAIGTKCEICSNELTFCRKKMFVHTLNLVFVHAYCLYVYLYSNSRFSIVFYSCNIFNCSFITFGCSCMK